MDPKIVVLKEGALALHEFAGNVAACEGIAEILKTTLGPRGLDKLIHDGDNVLVSNDGATILGQLSVVHPAARIMVDIARAQDKEVGDGTTTVCLLAAELLRQSKQLVEDKVHPLIIRDGYRLACSKALSVLTTIAVRVHKDRDDPKFQSMLLRCASTALNSKLISHQRTFFASMAVDCIDALEDNLDFKRISIKKVLGGSVTDSFRFRGVVFRKPGFAGFGLPKIVNDPEIALLNVELELESERSEIRISDPSEYQKIVDAEWKLVYEKLGLVVKTGANVVVSKRTIGSVASQFFGERGILAIGSVGDEDMNRLVLSSGGKMQASLDDLRPAVLGSGELFEERQIGGERFIVFTAHQASSSYSSSPSSSSSCLSIVLRGGSVALLEETERSLIDAIHVVRRALRSSGAVVAGGGAVEMELSRQLRQFSRTILGKQQLAVSAFARALEMIPRQLATNAGFNSTEIISELRSCHAKGQKWMGVDVVMEGVCDSMAAYVWEPYQVKYSALSAACEAACLILSIDATLRSKAADDDDGPLYTRESAGGGGSSHKHKHKHKHNHKHNHPSGGIPGQWGCC